MIEFRNVSKTYDTGTKAVKNANFVIDKGEFAFLVGTSGSGKSTLIKLILKEEEPTSGNIIFNGNIIKGSKEAAFCIGNEDNDINKNFKKCKNIVLTGNTFIENKINILKNAESFEYIEKNNIFID